MTKRITFLASALILVFVTLVSVRPAFSQTQDVLVEDVEIRGNRRIPRESILYYVQSKPGDRYNQSLAQRDPAKSTALVRLEPAKQGLLAPV